MLFSEYKQVKCSIRKIKKLFQNNKSHSEVGFIVSRRVPIATLPNSYHQRTPLARYLHIQRRDRQQLRFLTFREFYFAHITSSRHLKDQPINIWTIRFHNIISQTIYIVTIMMMDAKSRFFIRVSLAGFIPCSRLIVWQRLWTCRKSDWNAGTSSVLQLRFQVHPTFRVIVY